MAQEQKTNWKDRLLKLSYKSVPLQKIPTAESFTDMDFIDWLISQADTESFLLVHADDGVIWGKVSQAGIATSHDVAPKISPELRLRTVQQLRLFNEAYEVQLWRQDTGWHGSTITEHKDDNAAAYEEEYLLWGTHAQRLESGFTQLEDGSQGLKHLLPPFKGNDLLSKDLNPLPGQEPQTIKRACLKVRHYFGEGKEKKIGVNRITMSRFIGLGVCQNESE